MRAFWEHLKSEHADPVRLGWAVAIGLWIGISPFYGLHFAMSLVAAWAFGLNKMTMVLASWNVGLPLFSPFWIASGWALGDWVRFGELRGLRWEDARSFIDGVRVFGGEVPDAFLSVLIGDTLIGALVAALGGTAAWAWARRRGRRATPTDSPAPSP